METPISTSHGAAMDGLGMDEESLTTPAIGAAADSAMDGDMDEESLTPAIGAAADSAMDGDMEVERLLAAVEGERDNGVADMAMDMDSAASLIDDVLAALPELGRDNQLNQLNLLAWEN